MATCPTGGERNGGRDTLPVAVIAAVMVVAYAPLIGQVVRLSLRTTQAVNALLLVAFALVEAGLSARGRYRVRPQINHHGLLLVALSTAALAVATWFWLWPLAVAGLCLNLGALLSFGLGRDGARLFYPALAGLGATAGLVLLVPQADWWLRLLAAGISSRLLAWCGVATEVAVRWRPFLVVLVVEKGARVFDVATECNGFGILLSSVVLTVIVAARRRYAWLRFAALLGLALVVGLLFNTLRITVITLLALRTEWDYAWLHEGAGTVLYVLALVVVYLVVTLPRGQHAATGVPR